MLSYAKLPASGKTQGAHGGESACLVKCTRVTISCITLTSAGERSLKYRFSAAHLISSNRMSGRRGLGRAPVSVFKLFLPRVSSLPGPGTDTRALFLNGLFLS